MLVSGIRCAFTYVLLPFATPFLGFAPGVGPGLGIVLGVVAIGANVFSLRRFWKVRHPWRRPITAIHIGVIVLLLVLIVLDVGKLSG
jgi:riboflavin transporter FmnP